MNSRWFITRDGKHTHGPFTEEQLLHWAQSGKLLPTDLVWKEGSDSWVPVMDLGNLKQNKQTATAAYVQMHEYSLPDYVYTDFWGNVKTISFYYVHGTLVKYTTQIYTSVYGGGNSKGFSINTKHQNVVDMWICDHNNKEFHFRIFQDIPLREGHKVAFLLAQPYDVTCLLIDIDTKEMFYISNNDVLGEVCSKANRSFLIFLVFTIYLIIEVINRGLQPPVGCYALFGGIISFFTSFILYSVYSALYTNNFYNHCLKIGDIIIDQLSTSAASGI
ncbi:MAG: DUF4339 domain-containing protein [Gemmataceae bacterium]|nr:DUF4339 domain-containing protein [Gemmataceae bacterium]